MTFAVASDLPLVKMDAALLDQALTVLLENVAIHTPPGTPLAIEQDLFWYTDPHTHQSQSLVTHGKPIHGNEPTMRDYFFERIRPLMEAALQEGNQGDWPLVTLNLDFKSDEAAHHAAVWKLLKQYEAWICSAERTADVRKVLPTTIRPLLVLTGEADSQERDFYDIVPLGERLLAFGAVHTEGKNPMSPAEVMVREPANNYRRWWNNPWSVVERGGQRKAGPWTTQDEIRLRQLVTRAHELGLWIRFYTLDGLSDRDFDSQFTKDKPVIFNFHGYPWLIHKFTYRRTNHANIHVRGYKEKGNINTPLELAIRNQVDRFDLAIDVIDRVPKLQATGAHLKEWLKQEIINSIHFADTEGQDRPEIRNWRWPETS